MYYTRFIILPVNYWVIPLCFVSEKFVGPTRWIHLETTVDEYKCSAPLLITFFFLKLFKEYPLILTS